MSASSSCTADADTRLTAPVAVTTNAGTASCTCGLTTSCTTSRGCHAACLAAMLAVIRAVITAALHAAQPAAELGTSCSCTGAAPLGVPTALTSVTTTPDRAAALRLRCNLASEWQIAGATTTNASV